MSEWVKRTATYGIPVTRRIEASVLRRAGWEMLNEFYLVDAYDNLLTGEVKFFQAGTNATAALSPQPQLSKAERTLAKGEGENTSEQ